MSIHAPAVLRAYTSSAFILTARAVRGTVPQRGVTLEVRGTDAISDAKTTDSKTTNGQGLATFRIPSGSRPGRYRLEVGLQGSTPGAEPVATVELITAARPRVAPPIFIAGSDQRGTVNTTLGRQLVLEVRDSAGIPLGDYPVTFTASNGQVRLQTTRTDAAGVARITVTLGDRAGPVTVTATTGAERRQALFYAMPGPPARLTVERNGVLIERTLSLASRTPVTLTVTVRDAYGNSTLLPDLRVTTKGAVGIGTRRGAVTPGEVVVEPLRSGTGEIAIQAAGLRAAVPVEVLLPSSGTSWILGARGGGVAFSYRMTERRPINGSLGYRGDFFLGHRLGAGGRLILEAGVGRGTLHADTAGAQITARLSQGFVRAEYAFAPAASVTPVVTLGGGWYRLRSDDPAHIVYHTSPFALGGLGANLRLGPGLIGEVRVGTQRLYEIGSSVPRGLVATLTTLEVGMRIGF